MPHANHPLAEAHADYRLSLRLTVAHRAVEDALADERRYLKERDGDPRNDIAARKWVLACSKLALALSQLDYVVEQIALSGKLGFELAGGVS